VLVLEIPDIASNSCLLNRVFQISVCNILQLLLAEAFISFEFESILELLSKLQVKRLLNKCIFLWQACYTFQWRKRLQVPQKKNLEGIRKALERGKNKNITTREFTSARGYRINLLLMFMCDKQIASLFLLAMTGAADEDGRII
jgi:hypothetical protein